MTVGVDDELRIREYAGDDSANPRPVTFKFLANDDLKVTRVNADGSETVLMRGTHYSVAGAGAGAADGGSVTPLAPILSGTSWRIEGLIPLGQPTDYTAGDDFPAESHERGLDRAMIAHQEARRDILDTQARALMVPRGETAPLVASLEGADGMALGVVGGKVAPIANDVAGAEQIRSDVAALAVQVDLDAIAVEAARLATISARDLAIEARADAQDAAVIAVSTAQAASDALAAGTISDLVGTRIYSSRALLNADLVPADNLYALVVGDPTPANNDLYQKNGASTTGSWDGPLGIFAAASAEAQAAAAQAVDAAEAVASNFNPDPTMKSGPRVRPFPAQWVQALGTPVERDSANPLFGGAVVSFGGVIRYIFPIQDLPPVRGRDVNVRLLISTSVNGTSINLFFRDNGNNNLDSISYARNIGTHDDVNSITVPVGTTHIYLDVAAPAGTAKLFGFAMTYDPVAPEFVEAPTLDNRRTVYAQAAQRMLVLFGDSIIADGIDQAPDPDEFVDTLLSKKLDAQVIKCAFGGSTWAHRLDPNFSALSMVSLAAAIRSGNWAAQDAAVIARPEFGPALTRLKAVDFTRVYGAIIGLGTNDYGAEATLTIGADGDATGATFKGAINKTITDLQEAYETLRLVLLTPMYRDRAEARGAGTASVSGTTLTVDTFAGAGSITVGDTIFFAGADKRTKISAFGSGVGGTGTYTIDRDLGVLSSRYIAVSDFATNSDVYPVRGLYLRDFVDAIISRGAAHAIPVLDMHRVSGFNAHTAARRFQDGLHLSQRAGLYDFVDVIAQRAIPLLV